MKFNPTTQELFTDENTFLKKLDCPKRMYWSEMQKMNDSSKRLCEHCVHEVLDTAFMTDAEAQQKVVENPNVCFKVDFNQENLRIIG